MSIQSKMSVMKAFRFWPDPNEAIRKAAMNDSKSFQELDYKCSICAKACKRVLRRSGKSNTLENDKSSQEGQR